MKLMFTPISHAPLGSW